MSGVFGPSSYKSRALNDSVLGLRCVAADASIVTGGGRTAKNVTGYDIPRMLARTLGIYAVVAELTIKLSPKAPLRTEIICMFENAGNAIDYVESIRNTGSEPGFIELSRKDANGPTSVSCTFEGYEGIVSEQVERVRTLATRSGAINIEACDSPARDNLDDVISPSSGFMSVSLPCAATAVFLRRVLNLDASMPFLSHPLQDSFHGVSENGNIVHAIEAHSLAVGGKRPVLWDSLKLNGIGEYMSDHEYKIALDLKRELDPQNILNPHLTT